MKIENLVPMPFDEAVEAFQGLVPMTPYEFGLLEKEVKARAFTVSRISKMDIINDVYNALQDAINEGTPIREFQSQVEDIFTKKGWQDAESRSPYRIQNIYRTNIQKVFNAGRYKQQMDPDVLKNRPYWQYDAVNDSRTRPNHLAMDGIVKRYDDPFWETHYPPNGFQCRCSVRSRSARDLKRLNLEVSDYKPVINPDKGWDINPAKKLWEPDLDKYPDWLKEKYTRERGDNN
ncbi:MAG: hypothetical protein PWR10_1549 [Halanaerobiales bacterium]|nr:hypothetical protein [Halanaerobiales bacterium]